MGKSDSNKLSDNFRAQFQKFQEFLKIAQLWLKITVKIEHEITRAGNKNKNRTTGPEAHLVMADRAVSRLGFNR